MTDKKYDVDTLLSLKPNGPSRWELDNVVWYDRASNPKTLIAFLERIKSLQNSENLDPADQKELNILQELAEELDIDECKELLSDDDDVVRQQYIEDIARQSALETLCKNQISIETMQTMCRLNPNDFILAAKRSQDIINAVRELVIQGETLSEDIAGA